MIVERNALSKALLRACKLVDRSRYDRLKGVVRLSAEDGGLLVEATNYEESLVEIVPSEGSAGSGAVCVQAGSLVGVLKALPRGQQEIEFLVSDDHVQVGKYWVASSCPASEFPELPSLPESPRATVALPANFADCVKFVRCAVAAERGRFALNGVCFDLSHGTLVATDGMRMHCAPLGVQVGVERLVLRPLAFDLGSVSHLVVPERPEKGAVEHVFLLTPTGYVATIPIDGAYPEYWVVVREEHFSKAVVNRGDLMAAVQQVRPTLNPARPVCGLHLNEGLEVKSCGQDAKARFSTSISASREGVELELELDASFFFDALRGLPGEFVTLWFREANEAVNLVGDGDCWAVIMPCTEPSGASASSSPAPEAGPASEASTGDEAEGGEAPDSEADEAGEGHPDEGAAENAA